MNCNHNAYTRPDGVIGVGFLIFYCDKEMHSIAWPDGLAERMTPDELERKQIACKRELWIDEQSVTAAEESDETATDVNTTLDESQSPKSEAETIREYLTEHPDADNATVIAALAELKVDVTSSQVGRQRSKLKKAE